MISIDFSIVIQIVLFLIFWAILRRVLFTPMGRLMEERDRRTEGTQLQADVMLQEGKKLQAEYEAAIAKARAEGEAVKSEIRQEAAKARDLIIAQGREVAAEKAQSIRAEVQEELAQARQTIVQEAENIAQDMAEKILGRKLV
jgi:F-type H+-transporting ATPase subunit b